MSEDKGEEDRAKELGEKTGKAIGTGLKKGWRFTRGLGRGLKKGVSEEEEKKG